MIELMHGMGVDTLKAAKALEKAGFEPAQAEALVAAFGGTVAGGGATRKDLLALQREVREDIQLLRSERLKGNAELRTEMREGIAAVRREMRAEIAALRKEMRAEFAAVWRAMGQS